MPIEIRELIIKTTVNKGDNAGSGGSAPGGSLGESEINEIADKIFEIIKEKSER